MKKGKRESSNIEQGPPLTAAQSSSFARGRTSSRQPGVKVNATTPTEAEKDNAFVKARKAADAIGVGSAFEAFDRHALKVAEGLRKVDAEAAARRKRTKIQLKMQQRSRRKG